MKRSRHAGFTLVELLVVIAIITMLAGLLLPAVQQAREAGRRATCTNNQRQLGIAFINFDGSKGYLPGVRNIRSVKTGMSPTSTSTADYNFASWVWALLPNLDRNDIFTEYGNGGAYAQTTPTFHLKVLTCPNDSTAVNNGTQMTYVVNAGRINDSWDYAPAKAKMQHGVFISQVFPGVVRSSLSYVNGGDGTSTTLMSTENVDALGWTNTEERQVGFAWDAAQYIATTTTAGFAINSRVGEGTTSLYFPRPSSYHGGGVLATFCDSHVQFLDENISYQVYCQLMTSRSRSAIDDAGAAFDPPMPALSENTY